VKLFRDEEARERWGPAPYYLARVHAVVRGASHEEAEARDARRTRKDPAGIGDFHRDGVPDDEKVYALQWFVPLDALVAVCPTANAYLGEAEYPLAAVNDARREGGDGRVELAIWRPASDRDGDPSGSRRLYSRDDFADSDRGAAEACVYYDDRDVDEDVGVSSQSKYVWRFVFDPVRGLAPDPKKLRRDVCCKMGSRYGKCAFNNFHVAQGGGYVLCDGCDRAHHLRCVDIDPRTVPDPAYELGVRPNRAVNELGAVRGVRAKQRFAAESRAQTFEPTLAESRTSRGWETDEETKKRNLEPWFCGEACRRRYVAKQAKLARARIEAERPKPESRTKKREVPEAESPFGRDDASWKGNVEDPEDNAR